MSFPESVSVEFKEILNLPVSKPCGLKSSSKVVCGCGCFCLTTLFMSYGAKKGKKILATLNGTKGKATQGIKQFRLLELKNA
jgi:hypothetical protein